MGETHFAPIPVALYGVVLAFAAIAYFILAHSLAGYHGKDSALSRALGSDPPPFLAYALNGDPLTKHQGAPLRLIVPGWYGAPNVKWLSQIHAQEDEYLGKFQARWYRTLRGEMIDGEMKWKETAITRMRLKSFIARVTRDANGYNVLGVALNDGTPIRSIEVKVDDGPWQPAAVDPANETRRSRSGKATGSTGRNQWRSSTKRGARRRARR